MLNTNKGNLINSEQEQANALGINLEAKLTEGQIQTALKLGLDPEETRKEYAVRNMDQMRVSRAELKARSAGGEEATLTMKNDNTIPLTNAQTYMAVKMGVDPQLAGRAMVIDEQSFVPKGEQAALDKKKGAWGSG